MDLLNQNVTAFFVKKIVNEKDNSRVKLPFGRS